MIFNDEQLRENAIFYSIYRVCRRIYYGRTCDIETFKIIVKKDQKNSVFTFADIYSGENQLKEDAMAEHDTGVRVHKEY